MLDQIGREQAAAVVKAYLAKPTSAIRFSLHELEGFLFAVCTAPEFVRPSEWTSVLWDPEATSLGDKDEATTFLNALMILYNAINEAVMNQHTWTARSARFLKEPTDNFDREAPMCQWSTGFALGLDWLMDVWKPFSAGLRDADPEGAAELIMAQLTLCCFSSRSFGKSVCELVGEDAVGLDDLAELAMNTFDDSMRCVAETGRGTGIIFFPGGCWKTHLPPWKPFAPALPTSTSIRAAWV